MNKIMITGRLTRDPEIRYTTGDNALCIAKMSIAVNRRYKREGQPDADFFNCVAFGKTAEVVDKYFKKGMKADITGRLENNHYTDTNGIKHYTEQISIEEIEFGESKREVII